MKPLNIIVVVALIIGGALALNQGYVKEGGIETPNEQANISDSFSPSDPSKDTLSPNTARSSKIELTFTKGLDEEFQTILDEEEELRENFESASRGQANQGAGN